MHRLSDVFCFEVHHSLIALWLSLKILWPISRSMTIFPWKITSLFSNYPPIPRVMLRLVCFFLVLFFFLMFWLFSRNIIPWWSVALQNCPNSPSIFRTSSFDDYHGFVNDLDFKINMQMSWWHHLAILGAFPLKRFGNPDLNLLVAGVLAVLYTHLHYSNLNVYLVWVILNKPR